LHDHAAAPDVIARASQSGREMERTGRGARARGSRNVVLVGKPVLTTALARALSCSARHRLNVTELLCESLQNPLDSAVKPILAAESVVWISPPATRAAGILSVVHRLRSQLLWEGQLIAIAASRAEQERLRDAELFGTIGAGVRLQRVAGHHVLGCPVSVADTLALVEHPEAVDRRIWRALALSADTLSRYREEIESLTRRARSAEVVAAEIVLLLDRLDEFDWNALLHDHEQERALAQIRASRPDGGAWTPDECRSLLDQLGRVVSSTFVGGTTWDGGSGFW
jgi:hypothetical protein